MSSMKLPNALLICFFISPDTLNNSRLHFGFLLLIPHGSDLWELGVWEGILLACLLMFLFILVCVCVCVCECIEAYRLTIIESLVSSMETSLVNVYFSVMLSENGYWPLPRSQYPPPPFIWEGNDCSIFSLISSSLGMDHSIISDPKAIQIVESHENQLIVTTMSLWL